MIHRHGARFKKAEGGHVLHFDFSGSFDMDLTNNQQRCEQNTLLLYLERQLYNTFFNSWQLPPVVHLSISSLEDRPNERGSFPHECYL